MWAEGVGGFRVVVGFRVVGAPRSESCIVTRCLYFLEVSVPSSERAVDAVGDRVCGCGGGCGSDRCVADVWRMCGRCVAGVFVCGGWLAASDLGSISIDVPIHEGPCRLSMPTDRSGIMITRPQLGRS